MRFPYPPRDRLEPACLPKAAGQKASPPGTSFSRSLRQTGSPPNRLNCWSGIADFDRTRETRAGKRNPTFSRRRTKVAASQLPKRCASFLRNLWPTEV